MIDLDVQCTLSTQAKPTSGNPTKVNLSKDPLGLYIFLTWWAHRGDALLRLPLVIRNRDRTADEMISWEDREERHCFSRGGRPSSTQSTFPVKPSEEEEQDIRKVENDVDVIQLGRELNYHTFHHKKVGNGIRTPISQAKALFSILYAEGKLEKRSLEIKIPPASLNLGRDVRGTKSF